VRSLAQRGFSPNKTQLTAHQAFWCLTEIRRKFDKICIV
jgi:cytochrome b6-f complex subunit 5